MKPLFTLLALSLLAGCSAGMNEDFSCSGIDGIDGCVSMTEVNQMADSGQFQTDSQGNLLDVSSSPIETTKVGIPEITNRVQTGVPLALAYPSRPSRQQERVQEITIFPYVDEAGNYHATSRIFTVIAPSSWVHKR